MTVVCVSIHFFLVQQSDTHQSKRICLFSSNNEKTKVFWDEISIAFIFLNFWSDRFAQASIKSLGSIALAMKVIFHFGAF